MKTDGFDQNYLKQFYRVGGSVIESLCNGPVKVAVEILFLLHLITAFPILMNPPNQFFEGLFKIPSSMVNLTNNHSDLSDWQSSV